MFKKPDLEIFVKIISFLLRLIPVNDKISIKGGITMKKDTIRSVILVALIIALCFCVVQINELKQNIQRLENNLNYYVNDMRHEFNSVYSNVEQMLEEEASIVTDVQAEYGELNPEEKLVGLTVTLIPKELSEDMTLELSYGGKSSVFVQE